MQFIFYRCIYKRGIQKWKQFALSKFHYLPFLGTIYKFNTYFKF